MRLRVPLARAPCLLLPTYYVPPTGCRFLDSLLGLSIGLGGHITPPPPFHRHPPARAALPQAAAAVRRQRLLLQRRHPGRWARVRAESAG